MPPPPPPPGTFRLRGRRLRPPAPSERRRWRDGVGGDASRSPWSAISDATIPATTSPNHFPMTGRALGAWRARWTAKAMSGLGVVTPRSHLASFSSAVVDSRGFCPQVRIHNHNLRISVLTRTSLPDRPEPPQLSTACFPVRLRRPMRYNVSSFCQRLALPSSHFLSHSLPTDSRDTSRSGRRVWRPRPRLASPASTHYV